MVFAAPPLPPTATQRPRDGENVIELMRLIGVPEILVGASQLKPPFTDLSIVFPVEVPARITEKSALAAKHVIDALAYVNSSVHAVIASESPERIIRPRLAPFMF